MIFRSSRNRSMNAARLTMVCFYCERVSGNLKQILWLLVLYDAVNRNIAIDGIIKNQLDRCATGCNTQR
jgi:hypothetical protein